MGGPHESAPVTPEKELSRGGEGERKRRERRAWEVNKAAVEEE